MNYFRMVRNTLLGQSMEGWSPRDKWFSGVTAIVILTLSVASFRDQNGFSSVLLGVVCLVFYGLILRSNIGNARIYEEIGLIRRDAAYRPEMKKRLKQHAKTVKNDGSDLQESLPYEEADRFEPPLAQNVIEVMDELGETVRIPVLSHLDPDTPFDYLFVRVKGGKFIDYDDAALKEAVKALADIFDATLMTTDLEAGIGSLCVRAPANLHDDFVYYERRGNPLITHPGDFDILDLALRPMISRCQESLDDIRPMARFYGMSEFWSVFVITIRRDKTTRSVLRAKPVSPDDLYNLPVLMLARNLVDQLKASPILGYKDVSILREHELCMLVRQSWDIAGIDDFYMTIAPFRRQFDEGKISEQAFADLLWDVVGCWPKTFRSLSPTCVEVDGNYTSLIRMQGLPEFVFPRVEIGMHTLGDPHTWIRSSALGVSGSAKAERMRVYGKKTTSTNLFQAFFSGLSVVPDVVETSREELEAESRQLRHVALVQRFGRFVALVSTNRRHLVQSTATYMGTVKGRQYNPIPVTNTALHQQRWLEATLGIHT